MSSFTQTECSSASPITVGPPSERLIVATDIRFSEIISALSVALDITQGHSQGHCMRSALIGMKLAQEFGMNADHRSALFYALLLKDLGCSSNAAKMAYLFGSDDHAVKHSVRMIDWTRPGECLKHCWANCTPNGSVLERLLKVAGVLRLGPSVAREISEVRCERGAEIARMLRLPEEVAEAIYNVDELWNGRGNPKGLKGEEIPLLGRVCCLAQTVEVFLSAYGLTSAMEVALNRRGKWFDPELVDVLLAFKSEQSFWAKLATDDIATELSHWEPKDRILLVDEEALDSVATAFAKVVDAKSPWTYQHSTRVAEISLGVAAEFDCSSGVLRDLKRAALLHDIGKLGVSNKILDKPGKPTEEEFAQIRKHPEYTQQILEQVDAFKDLAMVAGAHHERLDGRGYHARLTAPDIPWMTRVLTVSDIYEAMSAERPYRKAMPWEEVREIMANDVETGIDPECFAALERWRERSQLESRSELQLAEVDRLLTSL